MILASVAFGGSSQPGSLSEAILEALAVPVALVALRGLALEGRIRGVTAPVAVMALVVVLPLIQLAPLPPFVWEALPGAADRVRSLALAGADPGWRPVSLAPWATLNAFLALLPPCAVFLATLRLPWRDLDRMTIGLVAIGLFSLLLGLVQLFEAEGGGAYLYNVTNLGSPVGLFANRNHEAVFLAATLPLAAVVGRSPGMSEGIFLGVSRTAYVLMAVVAIGVTRSRIGIAMGAAGALFAAVLVVMARSGKTPFRGLALAVAALFGAIAVALFARGPLMDRFAETPTAFRLEAWPTVMSLAAAHFPLGVGGGGFDRAFQAVEPLRWVAFTAFTHAHNDYLEALVDFGLPGVVIFLVFLLWLVRSAIAAWSTPRILPRAATCVVFILLTASLTDYPLRTAALASLFAFACGVITLAAGRLWSGPS
ncbi:MAG: O-antigen ligase family protein [Caulobacteraceae bacterium]|nr:O-antigen ligase family protein [Caulobacteraceae bacterium]